MERDTITAILPVAYWGDTEYFARLVRGGAECVIDIHEHYIKRSLRNRTEIMTANGVMPLSVCLCHADRPRTPICDVRIDYSKRWQHRHWNSIVSAYRNSPYFDFYESAFEPFYTRRFDFLIDLNLEYTHTVLKILGSDKEAGLSDGYISPAPGLVDLRDKKAQTLCYPDMLPPYTQVFSDRMPFAANMSILDLIFSEGPLSRQYIEQIPPSALAASI